MTTDAIVAAAEAYLNVERCVTVIGRQGLNGRPAHTSFTTHRRVRGALTLTRSSVFRDKSGL